MGTILDDRKMIFPGGALTSKDSAEKITPLEEELFNIVKGLEERIDELEKEKKEG